MQEKEKWEVEREGEEEKGREEGSPTLCRETEEEKTGSKDEEKSIIIS